MISAADIKDQEFPKTSIKPVYWNGTHPSVFEFRVEKESGPRCGGRSAQHAARKPQRQTVVLPPKKPPIPDSTETVRPEGTEGHHPNPAEADRRWRGERSKPVRLDVRDHHTRSLCAESPAQTAQWCC